MKNAIRRQDDVVAHQPAQAPVELTARREAAFAFAAERFMRRPEIVECAAHGSNGSTLTLPRDLDARLTLWRQWPEPRCSFAFAEALGSELAVAAERSAVASAVAAAIRAYPAGERAHEGYVEAAQVLLAEQAEVEGWSATAVTLGLIDIVRTLKFLPAPCEILDAVRTADARLRTAAWVAERAGDAYFELQASLEDAGMIPAKDEA